MTKSEVIRFLILRSIGNFLFLFAIFGVLATFGPAVYYEAQFRIIQIRGVHFTVFGSTTQNEPIPSGFGEILKNENGESSNPGFAQILAGPKEQILVPKNTQFSIIIPKIGASSRIFANVDVSNEDEFLPILQQGIAHARGTVFPGMQGNIYLFAHSTDNFWDVGRYNAVFYLLKDLGKGDQVIVFFENVRHNYVVYDTKIIDPQDVSYITQSQKTKQETLILQTCWPPGTTWKRLLVFARPT